MTDFTSNPDRIDSREVEERIEELIAEFIDATDTDPVEDMSVDDWSAGLNGSDAEELAALIEFRDDASSAPDWVYGAQFIHDSEFADYVEELLEEEVGNLPDWLVIDWEETARNIQSDYTDYDFRGETYWAHS